MGFLGFFGVWGFFVCGIGLVVLFFFSFFFFEKGTLRCQILICDINLYFVSVISMVTAFCFV